MNLKMPICHVNKFLYIALWFTLLMLMCLMHHLSNHKCKDFVFTSNTINDLLETYPEYKNYPVLCFKSDDCSSQYCCRYIFPYYFELSRNLNKLVILYYGVNGHGRGLVDVMPGFSVNCHTGFFLQHC